MSACHTQQLCRVNLDLEPDRATTYENSIEHHGALLELHWKRLLHSQRRASTTLVSRQLLQLHRTDESDAFSFRGSSGLLEIELGRPGDTEYEELTGCRSRYKSLEQTFRSYPDFSCNSESIDPTVGGLVGMKAELHRLGLQKSDGVGFHSSRSPCQLPIPPKFPTLVKPSSMRRSSATEARAPLAQ